ncbi:MAG TPA: glycoside hydrolase family 2 TIM barrel-domain containing protein, partial [Cyclobacteriaceae bacterium]|nr:glycoside hydrolase family 2 TIM barrel-domain containing protein [Cyclobacteriaceae bacterium]
NGHPLMIRGGNWGMSDAMLRCDKEGYDVRVRMHKDMNMNMIRNWIGMIGDEAFYEACDKYGIMVWDDFWLANPLNGTDPKDEDMFMDNMRDKMVKLRNHASIAIWCGRNEGFPPATLDSAMRIEAFRLDGTRYYLSNSADWPVTGLGPYNNRDPKWYFNRRGTTFHSEQGIVAVPPVESIKAMMPEDKLWPINDMWGVHDWTQERVTNYFNSLNGSYGEPKSLEDFVVKSQMMNMEGPKAMFESWQSNRGSGVLVWMTHPAWPSFICQAYDYYLEPNAAYFAFKKGGAPVHVLLRPDNNRVEVANNLRTDLKNVTVTAKVYDSKGNLVFSKELKSNVVSNSLLKAFLLEYPDTVTPVHFIKLELKDETGNVLSDNFYWRGKAYQDYTALQELPEVDPEVTVSREVKDDKTFLKVSLKNNTSDIALMARLKVVGKKTGKRLLPVFYEDNYFSLVPEEAKTVMIEIDNKHTMDDIPQVAIEGWNIKPKKI